MRVDILMPKDFDRMLKAINPAKDLHYTSVYKK